MGLIYVGDVGTTLELTVKNAAGTVQDISTASTKQIIITSPSGVTLTKTASFTTNGTDGKIKYVTISGDISAPGEWTMRGHLAGSGYDRLTSKVSFQVDT